MVRKSTAKLIKSLPNYTGDVAVYQLSKNIKQGKVSSKYVVLAKAKPMSGANVINVWLADEKGAILDVKPTNSFPEMSIAEAFEKMGYKL